MMLLAVVPNSWVYHGADNFTISEHHVWKLVWYCQDYSCYGSTGLNNVYDENFFIFGMWGTLSYYLLT